MGSEKCVLSSWVRFSVRTSSFDISATWQKAQKGAGTRVLASDGGQNGFKLLQGRSASLRTFIVDLRVRIDCRCRLGRHLGNTDS
jgi:hypothetical protein